MSSNRYIWKIVSRISPTKYHKTFFLFFFNYKINNRWLRLGERLKNVFGTNRGAQRGERGREHFWKWEKGTLYFHPESKKNLYIGWARSHFIEKKLNISITTRAKELTFLINDRCMFKVYFHKDMPRKILC
jgi:hypothetical protein